MSVRLIRDDSAVMSSSDFVDLVTEHVPEARPTVSEHLDDSEGELLLHLLMADLRRLALAWFSEGAADRLERLLAVIDAGLSEGDERVENAVAVSFVEDAGWWEPSTQGFIAVWPSGLVNEVERQRNALA
jgi:hypothetical protein